MFDAPRLSLEDILTCDLTAAGTWLDASADGLAEAGGLISQAIDSRVLDSDRTISLTLRIDQWSQILGALQQGAVIANNAAERLVEEVSDAS